MNDSERPSAGDSPTLTLTLDDVTVDKLFYALGVASTRIDLGPEVRALKVTLDNWLDEHPPPEDDTPPCRCGHTKGDHLGRMDDCQVRGCPCPLYTAENASRTNTKGTRGDGN